VAAATLAGITRAIRRGGLSLTKAPRIRAALRSLQGEGLDLDDPRALSAMDDQALWELLVALPGVGPKTAACVLLFSLDRPHFPVDTHVHRVAIRLGLVDRRASAVAAQASLQEQVPRDDVYRLHMGLIRHGREVCVARRPLCSECVLLDLCPRVGVADPR
ncbi:MAG: endonuclease III domain-containing protein, partial [Geminicoccales bacterium]